MKYDLSIIIPAIPGRFDRLKAQISRLTLSKMRAPSIKMEVIIVDGGSTDSTRELCLKIAPILNIKYVYLPINKFINAAYPRNVGIRCAEGKILAQLDIDHWPGENIVQGMTQPFMELGLSKIINRGYVIDSSESEYCKIHGIQVAEQINEPLLQDSSMGKRILDIYQHTRVPAPGINKTLWIWAVLREPIIEMNAYDENYLKAYCREDDDFRERLLSQGCPFYDGQNQNFCAIHLWHPANWRAGADVETNKAYFMSTLPAYTKIKRNEGKSWGRMIPNSYAVINGKTYEPCDFEKWISDNIKDVIPYTDNPIRATLKVEDN